MNKSTNKRTATIVIGTLVGAGIAWFFTSNRSAGARDRIAEIASQTKERSVEFGHETVEKTKDLIALSREVNSDEDWIEAIEHVEVDSEKSTTED